MKKLLLIGLLAFNANSSENSPNPDPSFCGAVYNISQTIMKMRQEGFSMVKMMDVAGDSKVTISIVKAAYDEPRWAGGTMQKRAIDDFSNMMAKQCYDAKAGK